MESSIPKHLQVKRQCPANVPDNHQPAFPAWSARFTPLTEQVVMAYFGVQSRTVIDVRALSPVTGYFVKQNGPNHWDIAHYTDTDGFETYIAIAYWSSPAAFQEWKTSSGFDTWWQSPDRADEDVGYFAEIVSPKISDFETLLSDKNSREGVAKLADDVSDEIIEHCYWGSARDRIASAQVSELKGQEVPPAYQQTGKRIKLEGRDNLCLIRSGQDWSCTENAERDKYLQQVEPVLHQGMDFLRDDGDSIGCLSCRYMQVIDEKGESKQQSFGLAHFTELEKLETWARTHPTHVAIFGGFMSYVQELEFNVALRLYHEIVVIPSQSQYFEYINCHPNTGLLKALSKESRQ